MSFCTKCGKENDNPKNQFCVYCGNRFEVEAEPIINAKATDIKDEICPNCGTTFDDKNLFCTNCGTKRATAAIVPIAAPVSKLQEEKMLQTESIQPNKKRKGFAAILLILLLILASAGGIYIYAFINGADAIPVVGKYFLENTEIESEDEINEEAEISEDDVSETEDEVIVAENPIDPPSTESVPEETPEPTEEPAEDKPEITTISVPIDFESSMVNWDYYKSEEPDTYAKLSEAEKLKWELNSFLSIFRWYRVEPFDIRKGEEKEPIYFSINWLWNNHHEQFVESHEVFSKEGLAVGKYWAVSETQINQVLTRFFGITAQKPEAFTASQHPTYSSDYYESGVYYKFEPYADGGWAPTWANAADITDNGDGTVSASYDVYGGFTDIKNEYGDRSSWIYESWDGFWYDYSRIAVVKPYMINRKITYNLISLSENIDSTETKRTWNLGIVVTASSTLPDETIQGVTYNYSPSNVLDWDANTAWVDGSDGNGEGGWISLHTEDGDNAVLSFLFILAGYNSSEDIYYKNARPKDILVEFSDGSYINYQLSDAMGQLQSIPIDGPISTSYIKIKILSTYEGTTYSDVCISEIYIS